MGKGQLVAMPPGENAELGNGKSCLGCCLSISSRCSCSPMLQPGELPVDNVASRLPSVRSKNLGQVIWPMHSKNLSIVSLKSNLMVAFINNFRFQFLWLLHPTVNRKYFFLL